MFQIGGKIYELVQDYKNGWNPEAFRDRYSEVLDRYDYIIGDWGYNQLRLKGFYREGHPKANKDSSISVLSDYINEYCNFGCAYFVLHRVQGAAGTYAEPLDAAGTGEQELQEESGVQQTDVEEPRVREHQHRDLKQPRERERRERESRDFKRPRENRQSPDSRKLRSGRESQDQREAKGNRFERNSEQRDKQTRFAREQGIPPAQQGKHSERQTQEHNSAKSDSGS
ncbi:YutD family protein [Paenibacillus enshidis]|uniref:YutD family protein n=1 Tax=Paenibacillus enshidis TaxID=1458439 RepID=A0ABV5ASG1_9BACL